MSDISAHTPPSPEAIAEGLRLAPAESPAKKSAFSVRVWSAFIFGICAGMLSVGFALTPNNKGVGTHHQLGLPPCGFLTATGIPCPTCGCTTAVSNFAHGRLISSFTTQPFGFLVGLLAACVVPLSLIGMATGRWLGPTPFWLSWHWRWWVYGGLMYLLVAWIFKIVSYRMMVAGPH